VAAADGTVAMRPSRSAAERDRAVVAKGVAGEQVVTDGVDKLQNGSKVTTQKAESAGLGEAS
jgi:hypothetical protein